MLPISMFLRAKTRYKDGKRHRYFSVVENRRVGRHKTAQRTVLYLGEINDSQQSAWRNTLEVFDESRQQYTTLSLFPEDRELPWEAAHTVQKVGTALCSALEFEPLPRAASDEQPGTELNPPAA